MTIIEPNTYSLPEGGTLSVEIHYERLCEGLLRITTVLFAEGEEIGRMLSFSGRIRALRNAPPDSGLYPLFNHIDRGYAYKNRIGLKSSEINMVITDLNFARRIIESADIEFIFINIFNFLADAGFPFDRRIYSNVLIYDDDEEFDYGIDAIHKRLVSKLDALIVDNG